jgi:signal transduction histidine kinase
VLAERNRMARDIHDTLAQGFTGVIVQLQAAEDARLRGLSKEADEHLHRAADVARESLSEVRCSVRALRPKVLEDNDWCEALEAVVAKTTAGTGLRSTFTVRGDPRPLPPEWQENLLRIGQEVLTNALRHARARHFKVQIVFGQDAIRMGLRDDGCGFDPYLKSDGFGLLGVKERVERMGGQVTICSAPGEGSAVLISVPFNDQIQGSAL